MQQEQVVIVGGGAAGLAVAGALKHIGIAAAVLDRDRAVGDSWRHRYDRLHLHTVRAFSGLPHFPIPRGNEKYLSREAYAAYLELYRRHFEIRVVHGCDVHAIRAVGVASAAEPSFLIESGAGDWNARIVVVATGMYGDPVVPEYAGLDRYRGATIHSSRYVSGRDYAGKRVLVIGMGNTGAEIAADLVEQGAEFVAVSIRTMPPIVPRDVLGTPVQLFGIVLSALPPHIADRIATTVSTIAMGDLRRYGLSPAQWLPFSARRIPVIDVGFVRSLKRGRIGIRSVIARFTPEGVAYADGSEEAFGAVIFATGYLTGLNRILQIPGLLDEQGYPKCESGKVTPQRGLYFMGFFESHRGLLFETAIASRRLARIIGQELSTSR